MVEIDAIEARANAAAPLPWEESDYGVCAGPRYPQQEAWDKNLFAGSYESETEYDKESDSVWVRETVIVNDSGVYPPRGANLEFILHAKEDVLALVRKVRELEGMIEAVRHEATAALASHRKGGQHCAPANSLPISAAKMLLRITGGER